VFWSLWRKPGGFVFGMGTVTLRRVNFFVIAILPVTLSA
jgi:hypothetical protein